jgi:hypothetical protein
MNDIGLTPWYRDLSLLMSNIRNCFCLMPIPMSIFMLIQCEHDHDHENDHDHDHGHENIWTKEFRYWISDCPNVNTNTIMKFCKKNFYIVSTPISELDLESDKIVSNIGLTCRMLDVWYQGHNLQWWVLTYFEYQDQHRSIQCAASYSWMFRANDLVKTLRSNRGLFCAHVPWNWSSEFWDEALRSRLSV